MIVADGAPDRALNEADIEQHLRRYLETVGIPRRVLLVPPDHTRLYSGAGTITAVLYRLLCRACEAVHIMPALGTHAPMSEAQVRMMFGESIPLSAFRVHDWRRETVAVGELPAAFLAEVSGGRVELPMQVVVNRALVEGGYDRIVSIGQVVPHEVAGMANYTKNICIGLGGPDMIHKSHFLGAACNMETIMGRTETPVRRVLDEAFGRFPNRLPIDFVLTVMQEHGADLHMRGLFIGDGDAFEQAAALSRRVNLTLLETPPAKMVAYLTPKEFASTWLGNKAIYRTRMAIADGGELIVLAPGVREFGEDATIDKLIRKYGYRGTPATLKAVAEQDDLRANLSAAAHLIHGSTEGRFSVTYCTGVDGLTRKEVESVGFDWAPYEEMRRTYDPSRMKEGPQAIDGEEVFYIGNPALGLWALKGQFENE